MRILVADDEPMVLNLITKVLTSDGHSVMAVADGEEALQKFQKEEFDLVITDFTMPRCDGPSLAKAIKSLNANQRVVLLSGFCDNDKLQHFDCVLEKPIRIPALLDAIRQFAI